MLTYNIITMWIIKRLLRKQEIKIDLLHNPQHLRLLIQEIYKNKNGQKAMDNANK